MGEEGIASALRAGVDAIEHGDGLDEELMDQMIPSRRVLVSRAVCRRLRRPGPRRCGSTHLAGDDENREKAFRRGVEKGVKISFDRDAGGFSWPENEAKEFGYIVKYGMMPMQAIRSANVIGAELPGGLEHVEFVMKAGKGYKKP